MNGCGVAPVVAPPASAATTLNVSNVALLPTSSERNLSESRAGSTVTSIDALLVLPRRILHGELEGQFAWATLTCGAVKLTVVVLASINRTLGPAVWRQVHAITRTVAVLGSPCR